MRKILLTTLLLLFTTGFFIPTVYAQTVNSRGNTTQVTQSPAEGTVSESARTTDARGNPTNGSKEPPKETSGCSNFLTANPVDCLIEFLYNLILTPVSLFLGIAGLVFDASIVYSIVNMKAFVGSTTGVVQNTWETIRDLCNIIFIGALLWASIETIIGRGDAKKVVISVIIAALLINFSLFFTKVIIDGSNIVSLQFYNAMTSVNPSTGTKYTISQVIMHQTKTITFYDSKNKSFTSNADSNQAGFVDTGISKLASMMLTSLLMLVTAFVFVFGAVLFVIRLVTILILMILSPVAFVGSILPQLNEMVTKKWWKTLIDQVLFAPAFMLMMWISIKILSGADAMFANAGSMAMGTTIITIIQYAISIGFMIASIIVAKSLGAKGADFATSKAGAATFGIAGWAGRNTAGRFANRLANSETLKNIAAKGGIAGETVGFGLRRAQSAAQYSYDARGGAKALGIKDLGDAGGKGGYKKAYEKEVEDKKKFGDYLGKGENGGARQEQFAQYLDKKGVAPSSLFGLTRKGTGADRKFVNNGQPILSTFMGKTASNREVAEKMYAEWDKKNTKKLIEQRNELVKDINTEEIKSVEERMKELERNDETDEPEYEKLKDEKKKFYEGKLQDKYEEFKKLDERIHKARTGKKKDKKKEEVKKTIDELDKEKPKEEEEPKDEGKK